MRSLYPTAFFLIGIFAPDTAATGLVVRGTWGTQQIDESKVDLYTQQTMEHIRALSNSGSFKSMLTAVVKFVRARPSLNRELVTSLFTLIKTAIIEKRKELREWNLEFQPFGNPYTLIDLPRISIDMITEEVDEFCRMVLELLEKYLLASEKDATLRCSYIALKADYMRYMAEFSSLPRYKESMAAKALGEYEIAEKCARSTAGLTDSSEILLGILLNRSVLEYEVMGNKVAARETCMRALENVQKKPSGLSRLFVANSEPSEAAVCVLNSIKRNVELWNLGVSNQEVEDEWIICEVSK